MLSALKVLKSAEKYLGVQYVYGGFAPGGFDCSGYVSKIWEISRRTTDNMADVVRPIGKDELLPGDALNYPQPGAIGHIRIFDKWAEWLTRRRSDIDAAALAGLRQRMFGGEFVFNVSRDFVRACPTPLLILAGDDAFHPTAIAEEIADLAPDARLVLNWKTPDVIDTTIERVRSFLQSHQP